MSITPRRVIKGLTKRQPEAVVKPVRPISDDDEFAVVLAGRVVTDTYPRYTLDEIIARGQQAFVGGGLITSGLRPGEIVHREFAIGGSGLVDPGADTHDQSITSRIRAMVKRNHIIAKVLAAALGGYLLFMLIYLLAVYT